MTDPARPTAPLSGMPGHLLRRAQQVHNALWAREVGGEPTSPQYAVLATLAATPGIDQRRLAQLTSLDTSSTMDVVARLERAHWITKTRDAADRRRHVLTATAAATLALGHLQPRVKRVQDLLLSPLAVSRRAGLVADLADVARLEPDTPASSPLRIPGHLLRRAQQVHTALFAAEFGGALTGPQYAALHAIAAEPGLSQSDVGHRAALDKSTVADIIDRLARRGWVERRRDPSDGRRRTLHLTETGAAETAAAAPRVLAVQEGVLGPLRAARRATFIEGLSAIGVRDAD